MDGMELHGMAWAGWLGTSRSFLSFDYIRPPPFICLETTGAK